MTRTLPRLPAWFARPEDSLQCWAVGSVYAMAFFSPLSTSLGQLAHAFVLVVALVFFARHWQVLIRSPLIWLALFFIIYVITRGSIAAIYERPDLAAEQWDGVRTWHKTAIVPIILLGMGLAATGNWTRHSLGALFALLVAVGLNLLVNFSPDEFLAALQGPTRFEFDLGFRVSAITLPTAILGVLVLSPYLLARLAEQSRFQGWGRLWLVMLGGLLSLAAMGMVAALLATKSRNGWLTLLVALAVMVPLALWYYRAQLLYFNRAAITSVLLLVMLIGGLLYYNWEVIEQRWRPVAATITQVVALPFGGDVDSLKRDSVGVRVAYWAFGWERFKERLWFGYGAADQRHLTDEYPIPHQLKNRGDTYHNSHLDILLRFGLAGYIPVLLVVVLALHEARRNLVQGGAGRVLGLYVVGFTVALAFWAMNAQIMHRFDVSQLYSIIIGTMCAGQFARLLSSGSGANEINYVKGHHS
ncbi:O-antigen ligase family protein [Desulfurivibrio dismutans]|uniref:O-antigen ligase family protein n=1 Tax=Desulfurivibrio dismutans TaxID=1398908 RepID=UPI0023DA1099|nr:O-antigen ligase family protein [Desulfurivibrio alkaliphilus]MDF1614757.1 O-antigen ligase family protein [Desulfurivibrio alkaliphilus]